MESTELDRFSPIISRYMKIEDVTLGDIKKNYLVRFRGRLYSEDTTTAYNQLAELFKPQGITILFRMEENQHAVYLMKGTFRTKPSKIWVNVLLFSLSLISVVMAGALYSFEGPPNLNLWELVNYLLKHLSNGIPFAASLLAILLAHEFGHYIAARLHKTQVTLPYFLPLPLSPLGTMGAFIQIQEPPKNKRVLLDISIAGPIAGLVVAIPIILYGLFLSPVQDLPNGPMAGQVLSLEGNSIFYLFVKYLVKGELLPQPSSYEGISPLLYWIKYIATGTPIPWGGRDVMMHSIAWAGWAGLLVTALNLIPAGQLDGGHVMHVLLGKRAIRIVPFILLVLILLGIAWSGWWLWAMLIFLFGRVYLEPLDQITPLDLPRKLLALLVVVIFLLVFIPVPFVEIIGR